MQTLWMDVRYGLRMLLKTPGWTAVVVIALALGIGMNTAMFSVVNGVLLRPLPYAAPDKLVAVGSTNPRRPGNIGAMSYPDFRDTLAQGRSFDGMAAYTDTDLAMTGVEPVAHVSGEVVSADLFDVLGVKPQLGRTFTKDEDTPGANPQGFPVVLSNAFWRTRFGGNPQAVGKTMLLDGRQYVIVGVMPEGFQFPIQAKTIEMWTTFARMSEKRDPKETPLSEQRGAHFLSVVGRLKAGVSEAQAATEVAGIAGRLATQYPETNTGFGASARSLHDAVVNDLRAALWILFGVVGSVLLITCANVANLLLARAVTRQREIAVRLALGAGRWRVLRQLVTESLCLSLGGGVAGWLTALWGLPLLVKLIPSDVPRLAEIGLDGGVFAFTAGVSMLTGLLFGVAPGLYAMRADVVRAIRDGGRGTSDGGGRIKLRNALVVAEIAVTLVVLVGAGLLASTFLNLSRAELGFKYRNVLTVQYDLPATKYEKLDQQVAFHQRVLERLAAVPGVTSVSRVSPLPLSNANSGVGFNIEGRPKGDTAARYANSSDFRTAAPKYFSTLGIPLVAGREFDNRDGLKATPVAIVNEEFVKKYFPNENPLGKRIDPSASADENEPPMREIVGIVGNIKHRGPSSGPRPEIYVPDTQLPFGGALVIRTAGEPRSVVTAVEAAMRELDRDIPLYEVKTMEQYLGIHVARPKFNALLVSLFAGIALLLTIVGLYGVMAFSVAQRTQEIGIRMALGAQQGQVLGMVIKQGMILAAFGIALGLAAAFGLTRVMTTIVYGVSTTDPVIFAGISLLLMGIAVLACVLPARRATRVTPMTALRSE